MKYFFDTEFVEGTQKKLFGRTKPTIDLISIGVVCDDGREFYAISNEFNLKEAWNRYDLKINNHYPMGTPFIKEFWIRENVLMPIFFELATREFHDLHYKDEWCYNFKKVDLGIFKQVWGHDYKWFKNLLKKYGQSNIEIAGQLFLFTHRNLDEPIEFYGYYCDYDWVVFCWLYGNMNMLPGVFPKYCRDLKQMMDERGISKVWKNAHCPEPEDEHNALVDARWNKKLHDCIKKIQPK